MAGRILIFRLGSLGDTIVTLPALHLVARAFPDAERRILTNFPTSGKESSIGLVLGESGLAHGYLRYPIGLRRPGPLHRLSREIRAWRPDLMIYLTEPRGRLATWRDLAYFGYCGVTRIVGAPLRRDRAENRYLPERDLWESEAARLARCVARLGDARICAPESWDLGFTAEERRSADEALAGWPGAANFLAFSNGAKVQVKDWGDDNWRRVLTDLAPEHSGLGLALIGAADEAEAAGRLATCWPGPILNLCGHLAPRVSALVIARARAFLGHDGGPMHLAAAVGTRVAAVFSARAKPGVWFPHGEGHRIVYHRTPCFDCRLETCTAEKKACILSIEPGEVLDAARAVLAAGCYDGAPSQGKGAS